MFIFALATPLLTQPASPRPDHFAMAMPAGFVVGNKQSAQNGAIEERVPKGETVDAWSRMITIITLNAPINARSYAANFVATVANACPGTHAGSPVAVTVGGHEALDDRMDCPRNPQTGKPETFFFRVLSAGGRLQMVQVAFRHVPSPAEEEWAKAQIAGAVLCGADSTDALCAA